MEPTLPLEFTLKYELNGEERKVEIGTSDKIKQLRKKISSDNGFNSKQVLIYTKEKKLLKDEKYIKKYLQKTPFIIEICPSEVSEENEIEENNDLVFVHYKFCNNKEKSIKVNKNWTFKEVRNKIAEKEKVNFYNIFLFGPDGNRLNPFLSSGKVLSEISMINVQVEDELTENSNKNVIPKSELSAIKKITILFGERKELILEASNYHQIKDMMKEIKTHFRIRPDNPIYLTNSKKKTIKPNVRISSLGFETILTINEKKNDPSYFLLNVVTGSRQILKIYAKRISLISGVKKVISQIIKKKEDNIELFDEDDNPITNDEESIKFEKCTLRMKLNYHIHRNETEKNEKDHKQNRPKSHYEKNRYHLKRDSRNDEDSNDESCNIDNENMKDNSSNNLNTSNSQSEIHNKNVNKNYSIVTGKANKNADYSFNNPSNKKKINNTNLNNNPSPSYIRNVKEAELSYDANSVKVSPKANVNYNRINEINQIEKHFNDPRFNDNYNNEKKNSPVSSGTILNYNDNKNKNNIALFNPIGDKSKPSFSNFHESEYKNTDGQPHGSKLTSYANNYNSNFEPIIEEEKCLNRPPQIVKNQKEESKSNKMENKVKISNLPNSIMPNNQTQINQVNCKCYPILRGEANVDISKTTYQQNAMKTHSNLGANNKNLDEFKKKEEFKILPSSINHTVNQECINSSDQMGMKNPKFPEKVNPNHIQPNGILLNPIINSNQLNKSNIAVKSNNFDLSNTKKMPDSYNKYQAVSGLMNIGNDNYYNNFAKNNTNEEMKINTLQTEDYLSIKNKNFNTSNQIKSIPIYAINNPSSFNQSNFEEKNTTLKKSPNILPSNPRTNGTLEELMEKGNNVSPTHSTNYNLKEEIKNNILRKDEKISQYNNSKTLINQEYIAQTNTDTKQNHAYKNKVEIVQTGHKANVDKKSSTSKNNERLEGRMIGNNDKNAVYNQNAKKHYEETKIYGSNPSNTHDAEGNSYIQSNNSNANLVNGYPHTYISTIPPGKDNQQEYSSKIKINSETQKSKPESKYINNNSLNTISNVLPSQKSLASELQQYQSPHKSKINENQGFKNKPTEKNITVSINTEYQNLLLRKNLINCEITKLNLFLKTNFTCPECGQTCWEPYSIGDGKIYDIKCINTKLQNLRNLKNNNKKDPVLIVNFQINKKEESSALKNKILAYESELKEIESKLNMVKKY